MESVAAERLTKIGKNPSIVSSRADLDEDQRLLNEIVMESTPVVTSASEDEDKDSDDSSSSSKSAKHKKKFKLDFSAKLHKITEERKSRSRENLKDAVDSKFRNILRKAPSGPNLFSLLAPPVFNERKRSGSVGANLGMIMENFPDSSQDDVIHKRRHHTESVGSKLFRVFDAKDVGKKKYGSKSSLGDESPSADKQNMQFLKVPHEKSVKSKDSSKHSDKPDAKKSQTPKQEPEKEPEKEDVSKKPISKQESSNGKQPGTPSPSVPSKSTTSSTKCDIEYQKVKFSLHIEDEETVPLTGKEKPASDKPVHKTKSPGQKKRSAKAGRHVDFEQAQLIPFNDSAEVGREPDQRCESPC